MAPKVTDNYKEQKRSEILESAKRVFICRGYESVTMKDIVDESGFSRGGVYLYYSSTEEIFLSILELSDNVYIEAIKKLADSSCSSWETVTMLIGIIKQQLITIDEGLAPAIYEYFLSVKRNEQVRLLLLKRFERAINSLKNLLKRELIRVNFIQVFHSM
jgi:AcrR family transcriptional regulator